ncbi:MAG: hypothetical protein NVSMB2_28120 [Chloroflexota bacterium]
MAPRLIPQALGLASGEHRLGLTRTLLRAGWPGTRVLKSALASGIAWAIASALGDPIPMFAVLAR